ncbi:MAG: PAS domain-containing protein, partial [Phycisphaeraceae bacterium]|nr:PAS domain-containing protein [Phycisphaeraceae bacterium]
MTPTWGVIHEDGSEFPGETHPSWLALKTGQEIRNVTAGIFNPKKNAYVWVNINAIPEFRAEEDKPYQVFVTMHDITDRKHAEDTLRRPDERIRESLDRLIEGCQIVGFDWRFLYLNDSAARQGRRPKEDFLGLTMMEVLPGIEDSDMFARLKQCMEERTMQHMENEFTYFDGQKSWFELSIQPVQEGIFILSIDITERKRAEQQIFNHRTQLKSLASELVVAEERERNRIAMHLHDDVCQNLAYSKMKLQIVHAASDDQSRLDDITEVIDTLTRMMHNVQTLTFELSSPVLTELGLEAAVSHWLTEQIEQKHGMATVFVDDGLAIPLEEDIRALLFRSVRELLANVVKHSQAKRVEVSIS